MKILHVGPVYPGHSASGVSESVRGWTAAQAQIGLNVGLLSSLPLLPGMSFEEVPGVTLLKSIRRTHYNPWLISRDWVRRIRTEFGTPDIVHFHSVWSPFQSALARRCRKIGWSYIITPHGEMTYLAQSIKRTKKRIANFLAFRFYVKHAVAMHALTSGEASEMQVLLGTERIITVPNGVDEYLLEASEKFPAADLGDFGRPGDLILGFVGRIDVYVKGLDLLFDALAKLKLQPDAPVCKLLLMGSFHKNRDRNYVLSTVQELGLEDYVKLLGPMYDDEKIRYLLAFDVYVQTSRSEAMPMSVLEAMALKRPCLVTSKTRVADMVREGGGWECKTDANSIAEGLKTICEERDSLAERGQRSQDVIRSRFTWNKVAQQLAQEYEKICNVGI